MTISKKDLAVNTISNLKDTYPELWQHITRLTKEYISDIK
ncbi:hypothetical protein Javan252_0003 [Streptococcus phage Javan252]|nr:hypothetical protein Javan252_0003 [Streptococcus phage Javan252]